MPKVEAALRRDAKKKKDRAGMQVTNRSIKSVLLPLIGKHSREARESRKENRATKRPAH